MNVSAESDAVLMQSNFAAGESVKVVNALRKINVLYLSGGRNYRRGVISRHLAVCALVSSCWLLIVCDDTGRSVLSCPETSQMLRGSATMHTCHKQPAIGPLQPICINHSCTRQCAEGMHDVDVEFHRRSACIART